MQRETCEFIPLTNIVPEVWKGWFFDVISDNAPFSWGDNDRTMVRADRLKEHCEDRIKPEEEEVDKDFTDLFLNLLDALGETYIDLET